MKINILFISFILLFSYSGYAQQRQAIDKIIAKVGNSIILQSDIDAQFLDAQRNDPTVSDSSKCDFFFNALAQQILVEQADRDSIIVSDEEVESALESRIRYWASLYGSVETMERESGKSVYQIKEDNRKFYKEKILAERMQESIMEKIKITPFEVQEFFNTINIDSLPPFPASVEVGQIVIKPEISSELEEYARNRMETIRKDIVEGGRNFATMAGLYGMDATKDVGGELDIKRNEVDPKFAAAAFKLQPGEISPVLRSMFGYHIIQMVKRKNNDEAKVRHIVIIPEITQEDLDKSLAKLDSIYTELTNGKLTFQEAVHKYSTDNMAKMSGGIILHPNTGSSFLPIDALDADMARKVTEMKVNSFSKPHIFIDQSGNGQNSCRIMYLRSRKEPHLLNLKDDYAIIQEKALENKKNDYIQKYLKERLPEFYIYLDEEYNHCEVLKDWYSVSSKK